MKIKPEIPAQQATGFNSGGTPSRLPLADIDLLIFDLDGTLVDSRDDLCDAVNYSLEQMGKPLLTYDQLPPLLGDGIGRLLEGAVRTNDAAELKQARHYFDEFYGEFHTRKTVCYPGVKETLAYFRHKKKAIFSNKLHGFTEGITRRLELTPLFDLVLGAQPGAFPLKPEPGGLQYILQRLGVPAAKALMVGDSTHDIEAARAAGLRTCAVTYGYRSAADLAAARPDFTINTLPELQQLVAL